MFWPDVIQLKQFYTTRTGQVAATMLRARLRDFWPKAEGEVLVGLGFPTPFLLPYLEDAAVTMAFMPASQGVIHWPITKDNLTVLTDEGELPLRDNQANRVLIVHALENSEQARQMLKEAWRILTPGGRLLVIAPNRRGIWARSPKSPFAQGHPFTTWQLRQLLQDSQFTPLDAAGALYFPPTEMVSILRSARVIEEIGRRCFGAFGGVLLMEAEKQLYAPTRGKKARLPAREAYAPAAQPATRQG